MAFTAADFIFGRFGTMILNVTILTVMASTSSAEVIAISSIFVSDIYMVYIRVSPLCEILSTYNA